MSSHKRLDGTDCDGVLEWGKNKAKLTEKTVIRRECALCGFRQQFNPKMQQWLEHTRNPEPGTGRWVQGS